MAKLVSTQEAANRLGVSRQTIMNWGKCGIVKIHRSGSKATLVDWETLEPLCGTMQDIAVAKEWFDLKTRDYNEATKELAAMIKDTNNEIMMRKRLAPFANAKHFFLGIPRMLVEIGVLKEREAKVIVALMEGKTLEEIGEEFSISSERVRQIYMKAVRKSRHIGHLKERLDEADALERKVAVLEAAVRSMEKDVMEYHKLIGKQVVAQEDAATIAHEERLIELLDREMCSFRLSIRVLNCLRIADIKTLGDLVRCDKDDLLKFRNFGRKSLTELDGFLEENGLQWGMDVASLYQKCAMRHCYQCEK